MKIYTVTLFGGYVYLVKAVDLLHAKAEAALEQGSANVQYVSLATSEDITWVQAIGGKIPKLDPKLPSEWAREGYYVVEGCMPKRGISCDYFDRDGVKRCGTIVDYDGDEVVIDGQRTITVRETFKVRFGR